MLIPGEAPAGDGFPGRFAQTQECTSDYGFSN
jgi:hypothetical protein